MGECITDTVVYSKTLYSPNKLNKNRKVSLITIKPIINIINTVSMVVVEYFCSFAFLHNIPSQYRSKFNNARNNNNSSTYVHQKTPSSLVIFIIGVKETFKCYLGSVGPG